MKTIVTLPDDTTEEHDDTHGCSNELGVLLIIGDGGIDVEKQYEPDEWKNFLVVGDDA